MGIGVHRKEVKFKEIDLRIYIYIYPFNKEKRVSILRDDKLWENDKEIFRELMEGKVNFSNIC